VKSYGLQVTGLQRESRSSIHRTRKKLPE